jgi:hypothetical protein
VLCLYDPVSGVVQELALARADVVRVSCAGGLRELLVSDLVRRVSMHHRLRVVGIWDDVPGSAELNVRPAEFTEGEADVRVGETVGSATLAPHDGLDPLAVRLALLKKHYRTDITLDRHDLDEAAGELTSLRRLVARWAEAPGRPISKAYVDEAVTALDADLDTAAVFPVFARLAEDTSVTDGAKFETAIKLDMILGLDLVALVGRL